VIASGNLIYSITTSIFMVMAMVMEFYSSDRDRGRGVEWWEQRLHHGFAPRVDWLS